LLPQELAFLLKDKKAIARFTMTNMMYVCQLKAYIQARGHDLVASASTFSALEKFLETKLQDVETFMRHACLRARKQRLF